MSKKRIIFISILIISFIILVTLVLSNNTNNFDSYIYNIVTNTMNSTVTSIYKVITFFGSTIFMVIFTILLFVLFIILKKKNISFIIASSIIISTILNNLIKIIIRRQRPVTTGILALVEEKSFSFPSGHMMASVTMYGILIYLINKSNLNKNIKIISSILLNILIILIGISRIYLGAHFASDILGALLVSLILLLIITYIINKKNLLEVNNEEN